MITKKSASLYAWSKDLEASTDVLLRERPAFAMLLGWLEKLISSRRLKPGPASLGYAVASPASRFLNPLTEQGRDEESRTRIDRIGRILNSALRSPLPEN